MHIRIKKHIQEFSSRARVTQRYKRTTEDGKVSDIAWIALILGRAISLYNFFLQAYRSYCSSFSRNIGIQLRISDLHWKGNNTLRHTNLPNHILRNSIVVCLDAKLWCLLGSLLTLRIEIFAFYPQSVLLSTVTFSLNISTFVIKRQCVLCEVRM